MLAGDNAEAIRVGTDALALLDDLGLDRLRPRALSCVGTARLGIGDLGGLGGLERAVAESLQLTSPDSVVAYINLASALIELARGFELQAEGLRMTKRFGFGSYVAPRGGRAGHRGLLAWPPGRGRWGRGRVRGRLRGGHPPPGGDIVPAGSRLHPAGAG